MLQVQHSNQWPPNLSKQTNRLYVKGAVFFLVESISIGKPIRGGRGVDPYTVLLRDAIPAVFYSKGNHYIKREEKISWLERIFGRERLFLI